MSSCYFLQSYDILLRKGVSRKNFFITNPLFTMFHLFCVFLLLKVSYKLAYKGYLLNLNFLALCLVSFPFPLPKKLTVKEFLYRRYVNLEFFLSILQSTVWKQMCSMETTQEIWREEAERDIFSSYSYTIPFLGKNNK